MQRCVACASLFFPPRFLCAACHGSVFDGISVDAGIVEACTTLRHRAGSNADLDISLGLVRLDGGIRVIARLDNNMSVGDVALLFQFQDGSLKGKKA
ncbi:MAG: Zn-ribbon domain-containing OB-fold protein [Xanthobacteraceae bacterium]